MSAFDAIKPGLTAERFVIVNEMLSITHTKIPCFQLPK